MDDYGDIARDQTAPFAAIGPPPGGPTSHLPALPPAQPVITTPPGWYPLYGEQRYWDGLRWTEHSAALAVPTYQPAFVAPMVVTDSRTNGAEVAIAWIFTVLTIGYMLPWAIAATRGKSNSWAVGLVNFLLGWTFIGWIAALIMACTAHQVVVVHQRV